MNEPLPFAITCVTCGSRLKVTNHDLIGSIDRCPKCGGMVQITAPPKSLTTPTPRDRESDEGLPQPPIEGRLSIGMLDDIDSAAITQTAISGLDQLPKTGSIEQSTSDEYATLAPPNELELIATPAESTEVADSEYRHEVEVAWQSESTQKTKQLVLIGLLALFGVVTAGIVFSQFVRTWRAQQVTAAPQSETADSRSTDSEPDAMNTPVENSEPATKSTSLDSGVPQSESSIQASVPPLTAAPFELDPTPDSTTTDRPRDDKPAGEGNDVPKMNKLPPEMLKHLQLFTLETTDRQAPPAMQPPPTIDTVRIDAAAEEAAPDVAANPIRKAIDLEKALSPRFAIENKAASLAELILIVSQLTTVPIELEFVSFDAANKRIDTPLKTPSGWFSARQWIDRLCAAEGLVAQSFEGRIMISASDQTIDDGIAPALLLDDFRDDAEVVFQMISPLLATDDAEPNANRVALQDAALEEIATEPLLRTRLSDDGRSIIPGASLRSRMRAVFAIESLRLMRGMRPKLERWRTARWLGPWPTENEPPSAETFGDWKLVTGGNGGPRLDSPRTAASLIRSIASLNQSKAVVGWFDVTRQDLFPGDLLMPYSREGTAGGMLEEILGDFSLQARVCGPGIWYIGTEASYDRFEVFTWLPIPAGSEVAIRERLTNSLSIADPSSMPVAFEGNRMLVRCPRYLARQMTRLVAP